MAAPLRQSFKQLSFGSQWAEYPQKYGLFYQNTKEFIYKCSQRHFSHRKYTSFFAHKPNAYLKSASSLVLGGSALYFYGKFYSLFQPSVLAKSSSTTIPRLLISREVRTDTDNSGLKLTLFQFQTCPFCCKVRAVLDYHGFNYDVIEVNSVTKKQLKWSDYRKVPILVAQEPGKEKVILRDSTVIISVLESYLHDRTTSVDEFNNDYPCYEEEKGRKTIYDFPNKYFIMLQDRDLNTLPSTPEQRAEERKWRKWVDDHLVHMLSPNVYRTFSEALQTFHYFSEVGEWKKNFSTIERYIVIYLGASIMYILGGSLKKKYNLKDDVRLSLYDACNQWTEAIGKDDKFMGGEQPNLADLAVYGVLNSIEGCSAFQEAVDHTKIGPWYYLTKEAVDSHRGSHPLNTKA